MGLDDDPSRDRVADADRRRALNGGLSGSAPGRGGTSSPMLRAMWAALFVVAALAVGACRDDDPNETGGKAEPRAKQDGARRADPSIQALSVACTAYWKTVLAELPPGTRPT